MVYTNKPFPNSEFEFPPPPSWLTWIGTEGDGKGKIRHQDSLAQCKKYLTGWCSYGSDEWYYDWAMYEWTGTKYELRYSGKKGEHKRKHPLWKEVIKKSSITGRDATDEELEETLQSILGAINV